jgi:hypothetical protein
MKLRWGINQLYFYVVCFVMLITIIVGITNLFRAGIDLLIPVPDVRIDRPLGPTKETWPEQTSGDKSNLPAHIIEGELEKRDEFNRTWEKTNTMNSAIQQIFRGLSQLLVAFPVYLYHWRKIQRLGDSG